MFKCLQYKEGGFRSASWTQYLIDNSLLLEIFVMQNILEEEEPYNKKLSREDS